MLFLIFLFSLTKLSDSTDEDLNLCLCDGVTAVGIRGVLCRYNVSLTIINRFKCFRLMMTMKWNSSEDVNVLRGMEDIR
jgi:hypothetical protein